MDRKIIDRYAAGATLPTKAIAGMSKADLLARPIPGKWSTQEVIFHLMDSDLVASDRMKRIIAEERPLLIGYNETLFVKNLGYDRLDANLACEIFEKNRIMTAAILRDQPPEIFAKAGVHNERGLETLEQFVKMYADHVEHHLKFVEEKRRALGR